MASTTYTSATSWLPAPDRNKGDGTFEEVAAKAGVALGDRICVGAVFVDYDNDGHPDLFVTSMRGGNVLFRNRGDGTFEDVTEKAGLKLKDVGHSQSAVFFDYDNDGYLDLFVTNTARWTTDNFDRESKYWLGIGDQFGGIALCRKETNKLYHNNRDGTFTDVTEKAGLKGLGWGADVAGVRLQRRRQTGPVCDQYVRPLPTLPQQRRRHLYRRHPGGPGPYPLGLLRRRSVRFQQRRPARSLCRGHALGHVDGPGL